MTKGKSKYYNYRIMKVIINDEGRDFECYALQQKLRYDILVGWIDLFWGSKETCQHKMKIHIEKDNKPKPKYTFLKP